MQIHTITPRPQHSVAPFASQAPAQSTFDLMGALMPYKRNAEIYGDGEPAEYLYKVVSGAVRTYKVLADGRRQVGAFYLPGDVFGLEIGGEHAFSAEAISDARLQVVKRSAFEAAAARDGSISRHLWDATAADLRRAQERLLSLIRTAEERVVAFLLEMAGRTSSGNQVDLPMSRQDIADYLGLTIETVSRTLTQLVASALIELQSSRRVILRNRAQLSRIGTAA